MKHVLSILAGVFFIVSNLHAGHLVITTTDYETGNTALYDLQTGTFDGNVMGQDDQDVLVKTDGEAVYFISKGLGSVTKYDPADIGTGQPIYQYSVGAASNPYDMVFLDEKAYVIRYGFPDILIVDPDAADASSFELGTIDLSAFDTDGVPDMVYGFMWEGMVYVVLQRLHNYTADVPGYLVKIDPATDTVIDLDTATPGVQGIELLVKNPQFFSQVDGTAHIGGHDWFAQTEGVQTVVFDDSALPQAMLIEEASLGMDITGICVLAEDLAFFCSSTWIEDPPGSWNEVGVAYWFDPSTGEVGAELPVPTPISNAALIEGKVYSGSRDLDMPGIYPVDPVSNTLAGTFLPTTLPPISMAYVPGDEINTVEDNTETPLPFVLDAPYPNPFNPTVAIPMTLPSGGITGVTVYNVAGQRIATLHDGMLAAGSHQLVWHAGTMAAGTYLVRVSHGNAVRSAKVTLVK